jgi:predicted transcriptional regulator
VVLLQIAHLVPFRLPLPPSVAPLSNDNYYDLGLRSAESVALSVSQSLRRDAEYRGEPEDSRTKARRSSFASTPNLGGNRLSTGSIGSASGSRRKSAVEQDVEKSLHIGQFGVAADEEWERRKQSGELGDIEEVHTPTGESDEESLRREKQFSSFAFGGSVTRESEELKRSMSPDRNRGNGGASSKPTLERLVSV